MTKKQLKVLYRILLSAVLMVALHFVPLRGLPLFGLYLIPYLIIGYDILRKAFLGIRNGEVFDENFLMAVATVGAMLLAVYQECTGGEGEFAEGVAVMLFYQIGELFQSVAVGKSRRNIAALMDIRPDYANVEDENGNLEQVDPDDVEIGTVIVVQPGEKVPIDGVVVRGSSSINTSALTGESVPGKIGEGDAIISGSVNLSGVLQIQTTKEFGESTVSKILDLVENSSMKKSRSENFISRFAKFYTPAVCYGALALSLLPPVINLLAGNPANFSGWIIRALTFLVISCPCALVISIPLSFFGGIGAASSCGILVKGSNYLEAMAQTKCVVFDKTGTLTRGVFEVTGIFPSEAYEQRFSDAGAARDSLLEQAAHVECFSSHPISKSLKECYGRELRGSEVTRVEEIGGHGVTGLVNGVEVAAGNGRLMEKLGLSYEKNTEVGTIVHLAVAGEYAGYILISDVVKEHAKEAVEGLKRTGIRRTVMLTGDSRSVAEEVAARLGVDEVKSELLPEDKVRAVEELLQGLGPKEKLAFVGDGINDAPVLTRADIGVAMGALGSDAAIEAADIVLMDDDPARIALAMQIARKCLGIVWENIVLALGVKGICLILGALGIANMWMAIFADVGVMVLAVLNAIRCLKIKKTKSL